MISHINIKNFAIIENLETDFYPGFNVITGETGSGKSIIIEAISMALGSRADKTYVRKGASKALIQILGQLNGEEYIITREISADGKSISKINGEIVTLAQLGEFTNNLADIHGQYAHQALLNPENHIDLLDSYKRDVLGPVKNQVSDAYQKYTNAKRQHAKVKSDLEKNKSERELISYHIEEIKRINPRENEDVELDKEILRIQNNEKIHGALEYALQTIDSGETSFVSQLQIASRDLEHIHQYYSEAEDISTELDSISYSLEDICTRLRSGLEHLDDFTESLDELIDRQNTLELLKKKHNCSLSQIFELVKQGENMLFSFEDQEHEVKQLEKEIVGYEAVLRNKSSLLSNLRKEIVGDLEEFLNKEFIELGFENAEIKANFTVADSYTEKGNDAIEFLIKTNAGNDFKPLAKVASGGELSRIMLAFKKITGEYDNVPTIIFDEIDTGISGFTANTVGKKLYEIGKVRQVISITHLPQIAAFGQHNFCIQKSSTDNSTYSTILELDEEGKVDEIAKMLSGEETSVASVINAQELINKAKKFK